MTAIEELFVPFAGPNPVTQGLLGGIVITGMNMLGTPLILVWRNPSKCSLDTLLGFAAGVIFTVSLADLILPGTEAAGGSPIPVLVDFVIGVVVLDQADLWIPHIHIPVAGKTQVGALEADRKMVSVVLFIVAITIHDMLEDLAVGVDSGSGDLGTAVPLMLTIGTQNISEELAVSVAAVNAGLRSTTCMTFVGIRTGLVEILLTVFGAWAIQYAAMLLPCVMSFAAGAMLFTVSDEVAPETHSSGHERVVTFGTTAGVVAMLYFDMTLG